MYCIIVNGSHAAHTHGSLCFLRSTYISRDYVNCFYMQNRNKVGELLNKVSSTRLHAQFAKAREADGHFQEAARAYENAHDFDSAVRCILYMYLYVVTYIITTISGMAKYGHV